MSFQYPTHPQRCEKPSFLSELVYRLQLMYYRYEVTFSAYVLTPGEKWALNSFVVLLFSLSSFGIISFLARVAPLITDASSKMLWVYDGLDDKLVVENGTAIWRELEMGMRF